MKLLEERGKIEKTCFEGGEVEVSFGTQTEYLDLGKDLISDPRYLFENS